MEHIFAAPSKILVNYRNEIFGHLPVFVAAVCSYTSITNLVSLSGTEELKRKVENDKDYIC